MKIIKTQRYKQADHLNTYPSIPKTPSVMKQDEEYRGHLKNKKKDKKKKNLYQLGLDTDNVTVQDIRS